MISVMQPAVKARPKLPRQAWLAFYLTAILGRRNAADDLTILPARAGGLIIWTGPTHPLKLHPLLLVEVIELAEQLGFATATTTRTVAFTDWGVT